MAQKKYRHQIGKQLLERSSDSVFNRKVRN